MSTLLNLAKDDRKSFQQSIEKYNSAVVAKDANTGEIQAYFADKLEEAKESIDETIGKNELVKKMLEKDSNKRGDYEKMSEELENRRAHIKNVKEKQKFE